MHSNLRRILLIVLMIVALATFGVWFFAIRPAQVNNDTLKASGTIEITQVQIGAEIGGRVVAVHAAEGDSVHTGDALVEIDTTLLASQRNQAEAALAVAQAARDAARANQALLQAGATEEQLQSAQALLDQAGANHQAVQASLYALTTTSRPEDLSAAWKRLTQARQEYYGMHASLSAQQIEDAQTAMTTAQGNLTQTETRQSALEKDQRTSHSALDAAAVAVGDAQASLEAARQAYEAIKDSGQPFYAQIESARISLELAKMKLLQAEARKSVLDADENIIQEAVDAAQSTSDDAKSLVEDAQAAYDTLANSDQADRLGKMWQEMQDALSDLNSMGRGGTVSVEALLNQLEAATAQQDAAAANLAAMTNGARQEQLTAAQAQVDAAQAQVDAAQAALNTLDVQISKLTIVSPQDGVVLTQVIQPGELALTGSTVFVLGLEDEKTITVYVPEERYGEISLGQEATLNVDSFPGVDFKAKVVNIANKAEFTPRNVQTVEGRKNTVFAIRLEIIDADDRLKSGMPADVTFE